MKHQQNYKIFFLFLCLLQLVLLQNSYAINIPRALLLNQQREQDLFLQFEKNKILRKIENEKLEKKIQKYKKSPKATNLTQHLLKIKKIDSKGTKGCFKIKKILLQESTAFSQRKINKITAKFNNLCINQINIDVIIKTLTNLYIKNGYVNSFVSLGIYQNVKNGELKFVAFEAKILNIVFKTRKYKKKFQKEFKKIKKNTNLSIKEKNKQITVLNNKFSQQYFWQNTQILTAFPHLKNKALNLRDIEQGLEQLNRLPSYNATMEIVPAKKQGYSIVEITLNESLPLSASISYNNGGSAITGKDKYSITSSINNPLKLNDFWYFSYSNVLKQNDKDIFSKSFYSSLNIPYGKYNAEINFSNSAYSSKTLQQNQFVISNGNANNITLKIERNLFRNQNHKIQTSSSFFFKENKSFFNRELTETSSNRFTSLKFSINDFFRSKIGTFVINFDYRRGVNWFDSVKDKGPNKFDVAQAQFDAFATQINYSKYFQLFKKQSSIKSSLNLQYSPDHLHSNEQIAVGGQYSVRGFKNDSLSGDTGGYLQNTFSIFLLPKIFKIPTNKIEVFISYDLGYTRERGGRKSSNGEGEGFVSGTAIGSKIYSKNFSYNLTYAKFINTPDFIKEKKEVLYFNASLQF